MTMCDKYPELISAYVDGELSEGEITELEAHLENCDSCRSALEAYREISLEIAEGLEEPPENFTEQVMEKVNVSYRKRQKGIITRWIGIAACIAVVIFAVPKIASFGAAKKMDMAYSMDSNGAASDTACPESSDVPEMAEGSPRQYDNYVSGDTDGGVYNENAESDMEDGAFSEEYKKAYSMVVTIYGKTPEALERVEPCYEEKGETHWEVSYKEAEKLAEEIEDCKIETFSETAESALIIVIS